MRPHDAVPIVVGQNPDTSTKSHNSRLTWNRTWSPNTVSDFSFGLDRQGALLVAAEGAAAGPEVITEKKTEGGETPAAPAGGKDKDKDAKK